MISKFINLNWTKGTNFDKMSIEKQYLNRLDDLSYVSAYALGGSIQTNYPKDNLHDYAIYKECRVDSSGAIAGLSVTLNSGFGNWNTMVIQFPKLNETNRDLLNYPKNVIVEWERIDNGYIDGSISFSVYYEFDNSSQSGKISSKDGLILIDSDLITQCGLDSSIGTSWDEAEYKINIYMAGLGVDDYFSISNLVFTNSFDIYVDDNLDFERENLDKTSFNKRTGSAFTQLNSEMKTIKTAISLLNKEELSDYNKFVRFNKSTPFYFFPYCNSGEKNDLYYSLLNLEKGGLYKFDKKWKVKNDSYNVFDLSIKLKEYK